MPKNSLPLPDNAQFVSPENDAEVTSYTPSPEEKRDLAIVTTLHEKGVEVRKRYDKNWKKQRNYYKGDQWADIRRPKYKASPVANIIQPIIETIIPILTDTSPGFDAIPQEPTDFDFADMLSKAIRHWWSTTGMDMTLLEPLYDQSYYDAGILKVVWNDEMKEGLGDVECTSVDPFNIYLPDGAVDFDKKCPWTVEIIPGLTVGELRRKFPDKAQFIEPTGKPQDEVNERRDETQEVLTSPIDKKSPLKDITTLLGGNLEDSESVTIAEAWLDDYTLEDFDEIIKDDKGKDVLDENGEPTTEPGKRRAYPYGKIVTWIPDSKVLLQSKPSPYRDGKKPYVRFIDTIVPRQFWGSGAVKPVMETQANLNRTYATIMDWLRRMSNPVWVIDDDANVDPGMITNQVGLIITKKPNSTVQRLDGGDLSTQVFQFYTTLRELADTQSGIHDITQGRKPTGITAAEAINTMQEAAQTRLRLKERNMNVSLSQLGKLVISRMLQYYTVPRMTKLTGKDGFPEYVEWYVKESKEMPDSFEMVKKVYKKNDDGTLVRTGGFEPVGVSKGQFDIEVASGTSLPFQKSQRGELAQKLYGQQAIDQEELLTILDWPRKEEVMKRMQEQAQTAADQQPPAVG